MHKTINAFLGSPKGEHPNLEMFVKIVLFNLVPLKLGCVKNKAKIVDKTKVQSTQRFSMFKRFTRREEGDRQNLEMEPL